MESFRSLPLVNQSGGGDGVPDQLNPAALQLIRGLPGGLNPNDSQLVGNGQNQVTVSNTVCLHVDIFSKSRVCIRRIPT